MPIPLLALPKLCATNKSLLSLVDSKRRFVHLYVFRLRLNLLALSALKLHGLDREKHPSALLSHLQLGDDQVRVRGRQLHLAGHR